ncbi:MAG: flavodoxin family protein [Butyricicoccus sp.]
MKVVAINGSPRKDGNCAQMLEVLGKVLEQEGIEFEVCQPGAKVHPCMACYHCLDNGTLRCVQDDDGVNEIIAKCIEADGIVLASPVYHGGIAGGMKCVLDRLILAAGCGDNQLKHKVGAALCTLRRWAAWNHQASYDQHHGDGACHLGLLERRTRRRQGRGCAGYRGR